jgi:large subunit ribosomal protein L30
VAKKVKKLEIKLIKSPLGRKPVQRKTVQALGLRKMSQVVEVEATPPVLGMVEKVSHLLEVKEIS